MNQLGDANFTKLADKRKRKYADETTAIAAVMHKLREIGATANSDATLATSIATSIVNLASSQPNSEEFKNNNRSTQHISETNILDRCDLFAIAEASACIKCAGTSLGSFVAQYGRTGACSYCLSRSATSAPVSLMKKAACNAIKEYYNIYPRELINISHHKSLQTIGDLLDSQSWDQGAKRSFFEDLQCSIKHEFTDNVFVDKAEFSPNTISDTILSWDKFVEHVKHSRRFTLWDSNAAVNARIILDGLFALIRSNGQIVNLRGKQFWRVRVHSKSKTLTQPHEFATVPANLAYASNRMSPAGIPMFYGAEDFETACLETVNLSDENLAEKAVSGMRFEIVHDLMAVNLMALPRVVKGILVRGSREWQIRNFLRRFVTEVSKPIIKNESHHTEYVPTQIVTEFLRHVAKVDGRHLGGALYRSSKNGHSAAVLFLDHHECLAETYGKYIEFDYAGTHIVRVDKHGEKRMRIEYGSREWKESEEFLEPMFILAKKVSERTSRITIRESYTSPMRPVSGTLQVIDAMAVRNWH